MSQFKPRVEILEDRSSPATIYSLQGHIVVTSNPTPHAVAITNDAISINGEVSPLRDVAAPYPVKDLTLILGDAANTTLNFSGYPTTVLLGQGQNVYYGGTGPTLVRVVKDAAGPHGFDAVVVPAEVAAVDVRGGPAAVIARPGTPVAVEDAAEVFRLLLSI